MKLLNRRGDNHTAGLTWGQRVGEPGCEYLRRWVFNFGRLGSIRVHHWTGSDDDRALHDHAWGFVTFVLKGGYTDIHFVTNPCDLCGGDGELYYDGVLQCPDCEGHGVRTCLAEDPLRAPTVRYRPALHAHTVRVNEGGCWTLMFTGPVKRDWGFYTPEGFKRMRRYFRDHGHHPCED